MTQFTQCFGFDLTDTLSCNVEFLTNFLKGTCTSVVQSETQSQDFLFSLGKSSENFDQLFLKKSKFISISSAISSGVGSRPNSWSN